MTELKGKPTPHRCMQCVWWNEWPYEETLKLLVAAGHNYCQNLSAMFLSRRAFTESAGKAAQLWIPMWP